MELSTETLTWRDSYVKTRAVTRVAFFCIFLSLLDRNLAVSKGSVESLLFFFQ